MKNLPQKILLILAIPIIAIYFSLGTISKTYLDFLWFLSLDHEAVWWKYLTFRSGFFVTGALIAILFYLGFFFLNRILLAKENVYLPVPLSLGMIAIGVGFSFFVHAPGFQHLWRDAILFFYAPDTGITDPIYGMDTSFYMFRLDFYENMLTWLRDLFLILVIYSVIPFFLSIQGMDLIKNRSHILRLLSRAIAPVGVAAGLFFMTLAFESLLNKYGMLYQGGSSVVAGASYTDVNARGMAYTLFFIPGIIVSIWIIVAGFFGKWVLPASGAGLWFVLHMAVLQFYPWAVQTWKVNPNEFTAEKEYLEHSIRFTRIAYGLDSVSEIPFNAAPSVQSTDLQTGKETIENIRLWDYRPTRDTFKQLQEIRLYYEFKDVDVDRYTVDNRMRQVMISARELNSRELPAQATAWIPAHLQYTHGYGVVMAPTNRVTSEGLPELWIKDFPPRSTTTGLPDLTRPEIYFGELTNDYILVKTGIREINYPEEQSFSETVYEGKGGIELGSGLHRLLLSLNFDTWKMLVSESLTKDSRLLFRRNIHEMVRKLAPFLEYDADPYPVIGDDGKLHWILDAYTVSSKHPYSARFDARFFSQFPEKNLSAMAGFHGANYVRNSVKVVIDAYDGTVHFYLFDKNDPIAAAWKGFFPGLFSDASEMPSFIEKHIRYPETLFLIQASMYQDYHMDDVRTFYNREDRWQISQEVVAGDRVPVEPYYTVMKLPGQKKEEYILMLPFIPNNKQNMIAWLAASCDYRVEGKNRYGKIHSIQFPRTRQIYGPMQIESRIDQDPEISKDLTLWNQQGSRVIRGNLLVVPIGSSLLYVEPIYLQSTQSPFPELRRVIVADGSGVVMAESLSQALGKLSGKGGRLLTSGAMDSISGPMTLTKEELIKKAVQALRKARSDAGSGNFTGFGENLDELEDLLQNLSESN